MNCHSKIQIPVAIKEGLNQAIIASLTAELQGEASANREVTIATTYEGFENLSADVMLTTYEATSFNRWAVPHEVEGSEVKISLQIYREDGELEISEEVIESLEDILSNQ